MFPWGRVITGVMHYLSMIPARLAYVIDSQPYVHKYVPGHCSALQHRIPYLPSEIGLVTRAPSGIVNIKCASNVPIKQAQCPYLLAITIMAATEGNYF